MRKVSFIWVLCLWAVCKQAAPGQVLHFRSPFEQSVFSQAQADSSASLLPLLLATDATIDDTRFDQISRQLDDFVTRMARIQRKYRSDERVLQMIFGQVQQHYLRSYDKNYPAFSQLFVDGKFNCVSGTGLYALILQRLGYTVEIHEKAFHAYLQIQLPGNVVLMDATDSRNGFVAGAAAVGKRILWYTGNELSRGKTYHQVITLRELCGLQYFNEGVMAFNKRNYENSISWLSKAQVLYAKSDRIAKLKEVAVSLHHSTALASRVTTGGAPKTAE